MADLSKIKLNGTNYNFKDAVARPLVIDAEWLGRSWEINHDRIGKCFSLSVNFDEFQTAVAENKRIILRFYNNTGDNNFYFGHDYYPHTFFNINVDLWYYQNTTELNASFDGFADILGQWFTILITYSDNTTGDLEIDYYDDIAMHNDIPSDLSSFNNDVGYLTSYTETDPTVPAWAKAASKPTYTASEVGAISTTAPAASITSNDITNWNNKLSSYTETDPTVPDWAKAATKPTYTATEVNALPNDTTYVSSVNGSSGVVIVDKLKTTASSNNTEYSLLGTTTTNNNTSAVSTYKQDLLSFAKTTSLSRLTIGSTATPGVVRIYTSTNGASGFTDLKSAASGTTERTITLPDANGTIALTTDIPSVPSWALNSTKPSYTFSELTSHPTTLNDYGITNAYTKTEVDGLVSGVLHYKGTKAATSALPSSGNVTGDVWHVTADGSEWAWDGSTWQELGTATDLSGYLQTGDIAAWAKAANKPTYTASEVGALPSSTTYVSSFNGNSGAITYTAPVTSVNEQTGAVTITAASISAAASDHTHGSITNAGAITANTAIASSDRLVFADNSDSGKLKRSTITFGSSTAQYLANNGTWQNVPAAVSVSNTLSSGTLIATINGTNIYAPAYTDADGVSY